jgi:hypothetical protein
MPCSPLKVNWQTELSYSSTLKMKVTCSSETSVDFQQTEWHYIPEDRTLHNHHCENVKSYILYHCPREFFVWFIYGLKESK